ncbi:family 5 glycoside hydrolase [Melampsora americana]|nr:family 5 glycoside hydrolase [Melampsora americana]
MSSSYDFNNSTRDGPQRGNRRSPKESSPPSFIPLIETNGSPVIEEHHQSRFTESTSSAVLSPSSSSNLPVPPKFSTSLDPSNHQHLQNGNRIHHHLTPSSPIQSSPQSYDLDYSHEPYRSSSPDQSNLNTPLYPPSQPSLNPGSRDSFALSSIHSPSFYPKRPLIRDSGATWQSASDSDLTRIGVDSPWINKTSTGMLYQYDDEVEGEGHTYPSPNLSVEKSASRDPPSNPQQQRAAHRKKLIISLIIAALLILLAIAIGIYIALRRSSGSDASNSKAVTSTATGKLAQLWGTEDGSSFIYNNTLGGTWVAIPYNDTARCQDTSPPLNQPWDYSNSRIYGVNLGGWLVLEPFITPYLFEKFNDPNVVNPTVVDEWTLSQALGSQLATTLEDHYKTFITEKDFADIASAGLNWIRIPVGWWMIETWDGEPFLEGVAFKYFVKALNWARKYGLRVNLDLHSVPGSQNGYNHSGKLGTINFLIGLMGVANAQYTNVVPMFSVLNEALVQKIGATQIRSFYVQVYDMMRSITGFGLGKGPMMVIHDGFTGTGAGHLGWGGFMQGADRIGLDTHPYFSFDKQSNDSMDYNAYKPCTYWAKSFNQTNADFGFNFAGEYSLAINDCGQWLNNIGSGSRFDGTYPNVNTPDLVHFPAVGSCATWNDYTTWSPALKQSLIALTDSSQDAMQNSFFWTWRISQSTKSKLIPNPLWSYSLGLQEGWIRRDARGSLGGCARAAAQQGTSPPLQPWTPPFAENQVGGKGTTSMIDAAQLAQYTVWPPAAITALQGANQMYNQVENLPLYTATGTIKKLTPEQPNINLFPAAATATAAGDGWYNKNDQSGWWVGVDGCQYPDPWNAGGLPAPTGPFCQGTNTANAPVISATPAP